MNTLCILRIEIPPPKKKAEIDEIGGLSIRLYLEQSFIQKSEPGE